MSWLGREENSVSPAVPDGVFRGQPASTSNTDFDRLTIFGGLRYDDASDVGGTASPRAGLRYEHDRYGLKAGVARGKGRKAASFFALGDPLVGNELLEPEDSEGVDFEIELQLLKGSATLELSGYRYVYSNLIDFDFSVFQLVNRGRVDTNGAELRIRNTDGQSIDWAVFVSKHRNEVDGADNALLHRPNTTAGADILWRFGRRWSFYTGIKYEGDRLSSSVPGGFESLPSIVRLDTTLTQHVNDELDMQFAVNNMTDNYYETVAGIPSPGRQFRLLLRQRF